MATIQREMVGPLLSSGIKQRHYYRRFQIDRAQLWAFEQIAFWTRKREVVQKIASVMLPCLDMFNVKSQPVE
jgi:hypothetical protein